MTHDPQRWLADPVTEPVLRDLLECSAAPLDLPVAVRDRVWTNLAEVTAADAAATAVGTKATGLAVLAAKPVLGVAILVAGGIAGMSWLGSISSHPFQANNAQVFVSAAVAARPAPSVNSMLHGTTPNVSALVLEPEPEREREPSVAQVKRIRQPRGAASIKASNVLASDLAEEARLLERARKRITVDPAAARGWLATYDAKFPDGALKAERRLLSVKLALAEGERDEAIEQVSKWEQSAKMCPYAKKAREMVGTIEGGRATRTTSE